MDGLHEITSRCTEKFDRLLTANMKWTIETNSLQLKLHLLRSRRRSEIDQQRVTEEFIQMLKLLEILEDEPDMLARFFQISERLKSISNCLYRV